MNKQRLLDIIAYIDKHPEEYDQKNYHSICDTKHCIAGFAALAYDKLHLDNKKFDFVPASAHTHNKAILYLDITSFEGNYIFRPDRTLAEIREFAETGDVPTIDFYLGN